MIFSKTTFFTTWHTNLFRNLTRNKTNANLLNQTIWKSCTVSANFKPNHIFLFSQNQILPKDKQSILQYLQDTHNILNQTIFTRHVCWWCGVEMQTAVNWFMCLYKIIPSHHSHLAKKRDYLHSVYEYFSPSTFDILVTASALPTRAV